MSRTAISGSGHDRGLCRAGAADPRAARPRGERPVELGQARHPLFEPLDLPLQGFDLLGVRPLFPLLLRGQPLQACRQLPFQLGHTDPSLSRRAQRENRRGATQCYGRKTARNGSELFSGLRGISTPGPYPVLASVPRGFLQGEERVGLRTEQDALPFIVPHHPAIGPQDPARDRLRRRVPPEPAFPTAHPTPPFPPRAFGLGIEAQVQLDSERVTPFPGHSGSASSSRDAEQGTAQVGPWAGQCRDRSWWTDGATGNGSGSSGAVGAHWSTSPQKACNRWAYVARGPLF